MSAFLRFRSEPAATDPDHGGSKPKDRRPAHFRRLEPSDAAALLPLVGQLGVSLKDDVLRLRLERMAMSADYASWVAYDDDGSLLGFCSGHLVFAVAQHAPSAHLTALVTESHARGRGVGKGLVRQFDDWARSHGADRAVVVSHSRRTGAHRSYDAYGFEPQGSEWSKPY